MNCTRCSRLNPAGSLNCGYCGLVFPPAPAPPATPTTPPITPPAPAGTPATPPAVTPATPPPATPPGMAGAPAPTPVTQTWTDWFVDNGVDLLRITFAVGCTILWLGNIAWNITLLKAIPVVGILYFVPIDFQFARLARHGLAALWILMCLGIQFGK